MLWAAHRALSAVPDQARPGPSSPPTHACIVRFSDRVSPKVALNGSGGKVQEEAKLLAERLIKVWAGHVQPPPPCVGPWEHNAHVQGHMRTPFFSLVRVRIGGCRHILPSMGLCGMCKCNHMHMSPDSLPCSCAVAGGVLCVNEDIGALHQRDQACSEIAEIMQGFLPYPAPACVNLLCSHACAASFPNISADNRYAVLQLNEVRTY